MNTYGSCFWCWLASLFQYRPSFSYPGSIIYCKDRTADYSFITISTFWVYIMWSVGNICELFSQIFQNASWYILLITNIVNVKFLQSGVSVEAGDRRFSPTIETNDRKVAEHKFMTIIYFFLSEIIFPKKMVSFSNNDRFDNGKIFFDNDNENIWHFSIITGIRIFFRIHLKDTWKNFVVNVWTIRNSCCEVQSAM